MESEGGRAALAAQVEALDAAHAAAIKSSPPLWYWLLMGVVIAAAVFVFSAKWGTAFACAGPAILVAGKLLDYVLARRRGIRVGRMQGASDTALTAAVILAVIGTATLGRLLVAHSGNLWAAAFPSALAIAITVLFGAALTWARRQAARLAH
jgi:hypothetical protein